MKIYTRTGDKGTTGLYGGPRVSKDNTRIEAYGTVDELNAILGLVRATLSSPSRLEYGDQHTGEGAPTRGGGAIPAEEKLDAWLERLQHELFDLGADLATPLSAKVKISRVIADSVDSLESDIDSFEEVLDPLKAFILPGGSAAAAHLHAARTVCRRAERRVITLSGEEEINQTCVVYLNRLSDALFSSARWINRALGHADYLWMPGSAGPTGPVGESEAAE